MPRKSRKVEKSKSSQAAHTKSRKSSKENGGVRLGLATGLGRIWYSLPLIGAEQRWAHGRVDWAGRKTLRPQNLVVAYGYSQFSFPCRCSPMLFQNHRWGFGRIRMRSRQHCYRFGSNRIGLGDVVSQGMDDGPMPKDHPDVECLDECLMKGFRGLQ